MLREWWTKRSEKEFIKKSQCYVDHYSKYGLVDPSSNRAWMVDGEMTLGENLADNGGLKLAFTAWKNTQKLTESTEESNWSLPVAKGMSLNKDQLFFAAFAQIWCSAIRPEMAVYAISNDVHALPKVRVLGSVSNSFEFASAYQCKKGQRMNPEDKCQLW